MKRVVVESPYKPQSWVDGTYSKLVAANVAYAKRCMRDCLARGEAPYASHLLFTQEGILNDEVPHERSLGIDAGLAWGSTADLVAVYIDLGMSSGMKLGIQAALLRGTPIELRALDRGVTEEDHVLAGVRFRTPFGLMWLDTETTGLDPAGHRILELSFVLTSFEYPYEILSHEDARGPYLTQGTYLVEGGMQALETRADGFVREMHQRSGLEADLHPDNDRTSRTSLARIEGDLLEMSADWPTDKDEKVMIAGNSAHFDLSFLRAHLPEFTKRLSYRTFDASGFYRFCLSLGMPRLPKHEEAHRAEADVRRSLELARTCGAWARRETKG